MVDDDRRTTDERRIMAIRISSPCEPNGSGELKICEFFGFKNIRKPVARLSYDVRSSVGNLSPQKVGDLTMR